MGSKISRCKFCIYTRSINKNTSMHKYFILTHIYKSIFSKDPKSGKYVKCCILYVYCCCFIKQLYYSKGPFQSCKMNTTSSIPNEIADLNFLLSPPKRVHVLNISCPYWVIKHLWGPCRSWPSSENRRRQNALCG